jgi:ribosome maturation factor RimP
MAVSQRLAQLIDAEAAGLGFELVRVQLFGEGDERTLQIMAEDPATGQMIVEQCAQLSRAVSAAIDAVEEAEGELIEGAYMLEVSSPGIDRPLTRAKDYANWAGHEAKLALKEPVEGARHMTGDLVGIEGDTVTINDRKFGATQVSLANIHRAQLILTEKLIAATQPLDASGVDEFEDSTEEEKADD